MRAYGQPREQRTLNAEGDTEHHPNAAEVGEEREVIDQRHPEPQHREQNAHPTAGAWPVTERQHRGDERECHEAPLCRPDRLVVTTKHVEELIGGKRGTHRQVLRKNIRFTTSEDATYAAVTRPSASSTGPDTGTSPNDRPSTT